MNRFKISFLFFITIVVIIFGFYYINIKKELRQEQLGFRQFKEASSSLVLLKNRWISKRDDKSIFSRVANIAKPTKESIKRGVKIFDFYSISQSNMKRVLKFLLNSHVQIKKISIKRKGSKISLHVEVKL